MGINGDAVQLLALDAHCREAGPDLDVGPRDANMECLGSDLELRAANLVHDETLMIEATHRLQLMVNRVDPVSE